MNKKVNIKKISIIITILYLMIGIAFYFIGGEQLHFTKSDNNIIYTAGDSTVGAILSDKTIEQDFMVKSDIINKISFRVTTNDRENKGNLLIDLVDKENNKILFNEKIDVSTLKNYSDLNLDINEKIMNVKDKTLAIIITSDIGDENNSPTLYTGRNIDGLPLYIDGELTDRTLLISIEALDKSWFGDIYWYIFIVGFIILSTYLFNLNVKQKKGKIV